MTAPNNSTFDPASNFQGKAEAITIDYYAELNAQPVIADPDAWWKDWTLEKPGAKIKTRIYIPVHSPQPKPWKGSVEFNKLSRVFKDVKRGVFTLGVEAMAQEIAEFDFDAFAQAPEEMAKAVGKLPQVNFASLLSNAYTKACWAGPKFAAISTSGSAGLRVCPGRVDLGKFLNAYENKALTPANITNAIVNVQSRLGFDGYTLNLDPMFLFLPTATKEQGRNLTEVQRLLPLTVDGVSGGGNDSTVFGRLKVVTVPGLRDDMWIVAAKPPQKALMPMVRVMGGTLGQYASNDSNLNGTNAPHVEVILHDRTSEMYRRHLKLGVAEVINEGWDLLSPHCFCFNYTASAS